MWQTGWGETCKYAERPRMVGRRQEPTGDVAIDVDVMTAFPAIPLTVLPDPHDPSAECLGSFSDEVHEALVEQLQVIRLAVDLLDDAIQDLTQDALPTFEIQDLITIATASLEVMRTQLPARSTAD